MQQRLTWTELARKRRVPLKKKKRFHNHLCCVEHAAHPCSWKTETVAFCNSQPQRRLLFTFQQEEKVWLLIVFRARVRSVKLFQKSHSLFFVNWKVIRMQVKKFKQIYTWYGTQYWLECINSRRTNPIPILVILFFSFLQTDSGRCNL
jgi:hypothetical protein